MLTVYVVGFFVYCCFGAWKLPSWSSNDRSELVPCRLWGFDGLWIVEGWDGMTESLPQVFKASRRVPLGKKLSRLRFLYRFLPIPYILWPASPVLVNLVVSFNGPSLPLVLPCFAILLVGLGSSKSSA